VSTVQSFYDGLASIYDLIYENWPGSIERQADALEPLIRSHVPAAKIVVDVACGIGTQALGLASRGFEVTASDASPAAVARAIREAAGRGLQIAFRVDDMVQLSSYSSSFADVLLACDNAIPHLSNEEEIRKAFRRFHEVLKPGGLCVISVRDYAAMKHEGVQLVPFGVRRKGADRIAVYQVWEWEGDHYQLHMYFTFDKGERVETKVFRTRYFAVSIERLIALATEAGFLAVERVDDVFFQPLIVAQKPKTA